MTFTCPFMYSIGCMGVRRYAASNIGVSLNDIGRPVASNSFMDVIFMITWQQTRLNNKMTDEHASKLR